MTYDDSQDAHRHQLLGLLFGPDVPLALEGQLLRTTDVATLFQVSERTVSEWAKRGQIPSVRTPGGHRRYPAEGIRALLRPDRTVRGAPAIDGNLRQPAGLSPVPVQAPAPAQANPSAQASTASSDPPGSPWASATEG